jgi:hypothetical protein
MLENEGAIKIYTTSKQSVERGVEGTNKANVQALKQMGKDIMENNRTRFTGDGVLKDNPFNQPLQDRRVPALKEQDWFKGS